MLQNWFDEGTRRKIHVLGKQPETLLRQLIHSKDLPIAYGGNLKWIYEDVPCLEDEILRVINQMPRGPVAFKLG